MKAPPKPSGTSGSPRHRRNWTLWDAVDRLHGHVSAEDAAAFDRDAAADPRVAALREEAHRYVAFMDAARAQAADSVAWGRVDRAVQTATQPQRGWWLGLAGLRWAAFAVAASITGLVLWSVATPSGPPTGNTGPTIATGTQATDESTATARASSVGAPRATDVALPDGSIVRPGPHAVWDVVDASPRSVVLALHRGRLTVHASHSPARQRFSLRAGAWTVHVVGTVFSVQVLSSGAVRVQVDEGKVRVEGASRRAQETFVAAGETRTFALTPPPRAPQSEAHGVGRRHVAVSGPPSASATGAHHSSHATRAHHPARNTHEVGPTASLPSLRATQSQRVARNEPATAVRSDEHPLAAPAPPPSPPASAGAPSSEEPSPTVPLTSDAQGPATGAPLHPEDAHVEVARDHDAARTQLVAVIRRIRRGDVRGALSRLDAWLVAHPHHPNAADALYLKGYCLYRLGEREDALRVWKIYELRDPDTRWLPNLGAWTHPEEPTVDKLR